MPQMNKGGKYIFGSLKFDKRKDYQILKISYKGRKYGRLTLKDNGVHLSSSLMQTLNIKAGDKLLAIRSSDIAFTLGAKGALIQKAHEYTGEIEVL